MTFVIFFLLQIYFKFFSLPFEVWFLKIKKNQNFHHLYIFRLIKYNKKIKFD